ncbi:hypothetical protein GUITHDRAFT_145765 [Guillardia theta CCMP2712]|uniref:Uncharacterized protein n=1 Tax=Guillardia theta (strain CCMP2712) TaxID=905079 RepID=L1IJI9_GUITC|nr:hypothetical protein GUITHDRAFT_145765 [Guillardia theta CCMP2712]EKX36396.1 hypothetical protein GUITHDRAFT_145765 [Guillardia theta CCMP2712]|eukprot:XP_005823376.1 hypothetical protein GUITHDRAFT_145765 [Guillardia theta CCMP2712]
MTSQAASQRGEGGGGGISWLSTNDVVNLVGNLFRADEEDRKRLRTRAIMKAAVDGEFLLRILNDEDMVMYELLLTRLQARRLRTELERMTGREPGTFPSPPDAHRLTPDSHAMQILRDRVAVLERIVSSSPATSLFDLTSESGRRAEAHQDIPRMQTLSADTEKFQSLTFRQTKSREEEEEEEEEEERASDTVRVTGMVGVSVNGKEEYDSLDEFSSPPRLLPRKEARPGKDDSKAVAPYKEAGCRRRARDEEEEEEEEHNFSLWAIAGWDGFKIQATVEVLSGRERVWREGPPLPHPLRGHATVAYKDHILVIGGWDGSRHRKEVFCLHAKSCLPPSSDQWKRLPDLLDPVCQVEEERRTGEGFEGED